MEEIVASVCVKVDWISEDFETFDEAYRYFAAILGSEKTVKSHTIFAESRVVVTFHANSPFFRCSVTGCSAEEAIKLSKLAEAHHSETCVLNGTFAADLAEEKYRVRPRRSEY